MQKLVMIVFAMGIFLHSCQTQTDSKNQISSNGYKYDIFPSGDGSIVPDSQFAVFHYFIYKDGTELIQSSLNQPTAPTLLMERPFEEGPKVAPIREVLALMAVGDSAAVYFPTDSMPRQDPRLEGVENLVYGIKLIDNQTKEEMLAEQEALRAKLEAQKMETMARLPEIEAMRDEVLATEKSGGNKWLQTPEGLKYIIHEDGEGDLAKPGQRVEAHYYGYLPDGTSFDASFNRGQTFFFNLGQGQVIQGWDIGFSLLKPGTKATLLVPADIGYGERGSPPVIPPNSDLYFYVEMIGAE